jgi:transcriptional regulator with GAF, ATPase, and Fis domain
MGARKLSKGIILDPIEGGFPEVVPGGHDFVHTNNSEFFIAFQSPLKDFLKPFAENIPARSRLTSKDAVKHGDPGLMATQTVAFSEVHEGARTPDLVRQSSPEDAERQQPSAKRTRTAPNGFPAGGINGSELIVRIGAAMEAVLEFIRDAAPRDSGLSISGGAKHLEATATLQSAVEELELLREHLYRENLVLRDEVDRVSMFEEIVGTSPALQTALSRAIKVAATDSTVLLTGETGTGKELFARAIHRGSSRASRAFVSVNCAAIPRELVASELFGHEKGAFTGAIQQRLGRFELANGGTLFLDEVGELPAETQIALLRVLQEHEFERVGGKGAIRTDVRVITATNRDLQAAISTGCFRSDLFYRLHVFPIEIPPLRERKEDIRLLVEYFIDRYARKTGKKITTVDMKTLRLLETYPWPGNIRELQNVIERSVIVCETANLSVDESWLSQKLPERKAGSQLGLSEKVAAQEKEIIEAALRECQGRVAGPSGAAWRLGIARSTLESKIRSLKIDKNQFRA